MVIRVQCKVLEKECFHLHLQFVRFSSPGDGILKTLKHGRRGDLSWFGLGIAFSND